MQSGNLRIIFQRKRYTVHGLETTCISRRMELDPNDHRLGCGSLYADFTSILLVVAWQEKRYIVERFLHCFSVSDSRLHSASQNGI